VTLPGYLRQKVLVLVLVLVLQLLDFPHSPLQLIILLSILDLHPSTVVQAITSRSDEPSLVLTSLLSGLASTARLFLH
jgi:hypothetical protein